MKRRQKAGFLSPRSFKITVTKEKERRKRKSDGGDQERGEEKKAMVVLLVFIMSYFGYSFWPKKTVGRDGKGPFDDNVFKSPARYIQLITYVITSGANAKGTTK